MMNQSGGSIQASQPKRWPIRVTLYQTFVVFSIVAACLLLRRIEGQQVELRTKRATLFSLNHDLYIDDPNRMASAKSPVRNPNELSWSVYIPAGAQGKLIVEGQIVCELEDGLHTIHAQLRRAISQSGPAKITVERLRIDNVPKVVSFSVQEVLDDFGVTEPTTAALGEKLPLIIKPGEEQEIQMWVEAK